MKQILLRAPFLSRIILAMILGLAAIVLSGIIYNLFPIKPYFPFVGEVLMIAATWLLYRTDKEQLLSLGLKPSVRTIGYLLLGLLVGMGAVMGAAGLRSLYTGEQWNLASHTNWREVGRCLYYILPTVMVQELMFRGYLFTKAISRFGLVKANVLFAIIFMLVHVLDRDVLQHIPSIISLAICIPIGHLWFATGLVRTKTLWFPIGLHWGNNWAVRYLAGYTDSDGALLYISNQQVYNTWVPFIILMFIFNGFFLLVIWAIWKWRHAGTLVG